MGGWQDDHAEKDVKEVVVLSVVVGFSRIFWGDTQQGTADEKLKFVNALS